MTTVLAGWEGELLRPSFSSVVYLWCSVENREEVELAATGCLVFSPLCRGVSHQLAMDRSEQWTSLLPDSPDCSHDGMGLLINCLDN